jgi:purine-binding chemotaxis protein CheW
LKGLGNGRFLLFELDANLYAIEVERVEVVLETVPVTRVPRAEAHLKGVINYRGAVIPVADLRLRFREDLGRVLPSLAEGPKNGADEGAAGKVAAPALPGAQDAPSGSANIIVLHLHYSGEDIVMGILADSVREVVDIAPSKIENAPGLGSRGDRGLVAGIGEKDGEFVVILDVDEAFGMEDGFGKKAIGTEDGARGLAKQPEDGR